MTASQDQVEAEKLHGRSFRPAQQPWPFATGGGGNADGTYDELADNTMLEKSVGV